MQTPAFVLSGFLGSGKTTLLLRLLNESRERGLRPGVMMNELGRQDVDGRIVDEFAQFPMEKLLDGCVCCNKKSELAGSIRTLLKRQPDIVFIELTGVANPEEIAAVIDESFGEEIGPLRIVTVLDAENVLDYNSIFSSDRQLVNTLRRQIATADHIVVNKTDLVSPNKLAKIKKMIAKQNDRATLSCTVQSQIDQDFVFAGVRPSSSAAQATTAFRVLSGSASAETADHHSHSHADTHADASYSQVKTVTLTPPAELVIDKRQLERFLADCGERIIRAKGYIRTADRVQLLQYAGNRPTWEDSSYPGKPYLVIIGLELDEDRLLRHWTALLDASRGEAAQARRH